MSTSTTATKRRPRVSFSRFSQQVLIPKDQKDSKWYSLQERNGLRQDSVQEARRMANVLEAVTTKGGITLEQLLECVGIENFVTRGLAKQVVESSYPRSTFRAKASKAAGHHWQQDVMHNVQAQVEVVQG